VAGSQRILLVRLGAIGDALRVLPAVRRLRVDLPDVRIGWAVEDWVYPALAGNPNVDCFHVLDRRALRRGGRTALAELHRFASELRAQRYDVAVDLQGRLKSGIVSWLSGAPRRLGYARGDGSEGSFLFATERVRLADSRENRVLRFLHLLEPLGIEPQPVPGDLGLHVDPEVGQMARDWYAAASNPVLAIYPGGTADRSAFLRWQTDRWSQLLTRLAAAGYPSVVFWGPGEEDLADEIVAAVAGDCRVAPATTLPQMAAMLGCFPVYVGANTAALHMAWLLGVATVFFPGPARPRTDSPCTDVPFRVLWAGQYFREGESKSRQPECVREVTVDEAEEAVLSLLAERLRGRAR